MSFDPDDWKRLESILDRALELDAKHRRELLDELCGDDANLRAEAERLLRAADASSGFLEQPVESFLPAPNQAPIGPEVPLRAGPYRIERVLGRGGMGEVWLGRRDDGQFEQFVALKLIAQLATSEEISRRFLAERQILARLEHPNIARLLDGGVTDDGRPWFAMELVDGRPITEHAAAARLDVRTRVELFLTVCDAVRHAHRNLIVHRDLKPSNILVGKDGTVKLLDFGIAKLLTAEDGDTGAQATLTVLTPEYAAPEQVRGDSVTTATDVHGLGLVLYELLCGVRPFLHTSSSPLVVARSVLEQEPLAPSRGLATRAERPASVAAERRTTPERLRRELSGDLDAIVMQALRKEPRDRYPTVDALRDDLTRWLEGRPVAARKGNRVYLARKFVRRHRALLAASTIVVVSLVVGLGAALWQAREARRAEARADAVTSFFVGEMIETAAPEVSRGREITIREVLDATAVRVESDLTEQPEVAADVRAALGRTYAGLGALDEAVEQLNTAVELLRARHGERDPETLRVAAALGAALTERGDYDEAEQVLGETLRAQQAGEPNGLDVLTTRGLLADLERRRGNYLAAERAMRELLPTLERQYPEAWRERLLILSRLVTALEMQRKSVEAEAVCLQTLELQRDRLGEDHPDTVRTLSLLGKIQRRLARYEEAERTLLRARELAERVLGPAHADTLELLSNLGTVQWFRDQPERSLETFTLARERAEGSLGADHPRTLLADLNLAVMLRRLDRLDEAERIYLELIRRSRSALGDTHPTTMKAVTYLGTLYWHAGRLDEAERRYREVIDIGRRLVANPGADATALNDYAWFLLTCSIEHLQDPAAALVPAERAVESTGSRQAEFVDTLAAVHYRLGNLDRAIELQREAMRLPDSVYRSGMKERMIRYLEDAGDDRALEAFLREDLERCRELRSADDPLIAEASERLAAHLARGP